MLTNSESEGSKSVKSNSSKQTAENEASSKSSSNDKDKSGKTILRKGNYPSIVINNRKAESRQKPRPRAKEEFGVGRGRYEERRGYRGRGGISRKDRDDPGYSRNRYEPLSKSKSYGSYPNCSEYDGGGDQNLSSAGSIPEDSRISTQLRRLAREDDEKKFKSLCKTLQEALANPDNATYVRRSLDMILESLYDLFRTAVTQYCKNLAAKCIGHVGYHLERDFRKFLDWIFNRFNSETKEANRTYLMKALYELTFLDHKQPKLAEHAEHIMSLVRGVMESTDVGDIFIVTAEITLALTSRYSTTFSEYFHDTVDIIVGWHIDIHQPYGVLRCANKCLKSLLPYWVSDMGFTTNLLHQFLEDAENYKEELLTIEDAPREKEIEIVKKITSFIGVFDSLFSALGDHMSPEKTAAVSYAFLIESLGKVMEIVLKTLEPEVHNDLIIAGNSCASLILGYLKTEALAVSDSVHIYIYSLLGKCESLSKLCLSSLFVFISKVLDVLNEATTDKLIDTLLQPDSILLSMRLTNVRDDVLCVYHALLKLSDENCFIQAYGHVIADLEAALRGIDPNVTFVFPENNPHSGVVYKSESEAKAVLTFLFEALGLLATCRGMANLVNMKPSLFKILAEHIPKIITPLKHPDLHYALLYFLKSHCSAFDYFIVSNGIVSAASGRKRLADLLGIRTSNGFETSPTTSYLLTIINLLINNLNADMEESTKILCIRWAVDLLLLGKRFHTMLRETTEVIELVKAVTVAAMDTRKTVNRVAISCLKQLLTAYKGLWPHSVMKLFLETSVYFVNSVHPDLRKDYHEFMDMLPCLVTTFSIDGIAAEPACALRVLLMKQYEDICGTVNVEMTTYFFKLFTAYLLTGHNDGDLLWMKDMMIRCSPVLDASYENGQAIIGNQAALCGWAAFEAVHLCVDNKLRTPLGRALETFMAFEGMIRDLAKETLTRTSSSKPPISGLRARLLIQFVEQLEKSMYNASEGTALAFPPAQKSVATFFLTNRAVCQDWMTRIRFALLVICIHCGLASAAVRHGFAFLQTLLELNSANSPEFESTLISVGKALSNLGEREAVEGLYAWAKDTANVNCQILLPLIDQAGRKYEKAIEGYIDILKDNVINDPVEENQNGESDSKNKISVFNTKTFIFDQITECYLSVNDWKGLAEWKENESLFVENENGSSTRRFKYIQARHMQAVDLFDKGEYIAAKSLLEWKCSKADDNKPVWDYCNVLNEVDFTLRNIAITITNEPASALEQCCIDYIKKSKITAEKILEDTVKDAPSEVMNKAVLIKYIAHSLIERQNFIDSPLYGCEYKTWKSNIKSPVMEQALWWGLALNNVHRRLRQSQSMKQFTLEVAKVSRKEGNYKFADNALKEHLLLLGLRTRNCPLSIIELTDEYMKSWGSVDRQWSMDNTNALREMTKLLISIGNKEKGIELSSFTALGLSEKTSVDFRFVGANLLRKLSAWIVGGSETLSNKYLNNLLELEAAREIPSFIADLSCCPIKPKGAVSEEDALVGRLLRLSILTYPSMCKSWERLACWAYSCALNCLNKVHEGLTPEDKTLIQANLPSGIESDKVFDILTSNSLNKDSEDIEGDATSCEIVEQQLKEIGLINEEQLEKMLGVWRKIHLQVYNHFRLSAYAYFKYIEISEYHEENNMIVTATLRLLRLIVKHSHEVQEVVETGLGCSPTSPWMAIVPQLFSRLNHPEPYVRKRVAELLSRIGVDSPHLIIFPAVVGSHTGASTIKEMPNTRLFRLKQQYHDHDDDDEDDDDDDDEIEEEEDNEEEDDGNDDDVKTSNERAACLENSFLGILDNLSKKYGEEISQVKMLVSELRRITLLWDELWLGALTQHQTDIARRFIQLQAELKATDANAHLSQSVRDNLIAEKHRLILKPLLFILEQLHAITSVTPETPHEKRFQDKYGKDIEEVLLRLREPSNPRLPGESFGPLKALQSKLQITISNTTRSQMPLRMEDISPPLATLKDSVIAMPGLRDPVTIKSIVNNVAILPTKTKPKKLVFNGSDGKQYTYLFKGLEDLHLDERIMQFLSIANSMLREERLRACHYSVIPLGPRSGLISWVENVTPIFSLYKKWQHRDAANNDQCTSQILRPNELLYSKLLPILKEVGINSIDPLHRNKWPLSALKKCLLELMQITPNYLLSRELWCHSVNSSDWWQITKTYSCSLAVMSMIGYIIGLGDRHLDNVLVNLKTGEVVHIDYNVCFEKGKTLRVPEKVPFRLTPNLVAALGVSGIEGLYRLTCEHVLRVLKCGQETLLTLLEAFVYDPLIDWTPLNEGGYTGAVYGGGREFASETKQTKKDLEREVTCCMFKVRMVEVKQQWLDNKELMLKELEELLSIIDVWQSERAHLKKLQQSLQERHSQLSLLKEAEGQPTHSLYTLGLRYTKHIQVLNAKQNVQVALKTRIQDCEAQITSYQAVMIALKGPDIQKWTAELTQQPKEDVFQVFDLIKEFLQNAGQNQMVQQCSQSEREMGELCVQQTHLCSVMLDMLRQYFEVSRLYPASSVLSHRSSLYKRWCQMLLDDMSPPTREEVLREMKSALSTSDETMREAAMFSAGLHRHHSDAQTALRKAAERAKALPPHPGYDLETTKLDPQAVEAVVLTALCALNKRFLMMEAAATSAGDCLLNLTSREGDWFLDDMVLIGSTALHLVPLIPSVIRENIDPNITTAIKCLNSSFAQYKALQEVHINFTSIILVEAMQGLQCEEPSVLEMVGRLESVVSSAGVSLADLLHQLQLHLRFTIMGMESPHETCLSSVENLKIEFASLLEPRDPGLLTQGEMLLMGFNGLFTNVSHGREPLLQSLAALQSPPAWKTVDQIREAKSHYTAPICEEKTREVLECMFFIKRLDTMTEVLRLVNGDAKSFRAEPNSQPVPYDPECLSKPVRRYIADYISFQLHGVFSLSLATTICLLLQENGLDVTGAVEQKDIGAQSRVPLEELCKKKSPGDDLIPNCVLKNLPRKALAYLLSIINACLRMGYFPEKWKNAIVTLLHKPGKPKDDPMGYRPISLPWRPRGMVEDGSRGPGPPRTVAPEIGLELDNNMAFQMVEQLNRTAVREASGMVSQRENAWRQGQLKSRLDRELASAEGALVRTQLRLTAHYWLHEHYLVNSPPPPLNRSMFMMDLRKTASTLSIIQPKLNEALEQQNSLISSAEQRLKWAAGANPALSEVMSAFENCVKVHRDRVEKERNLSQQIISMANAIILHEVLRTPTQEAIVSDNSMARLVEDCEKAYGLIQNTPVTLTGPEEGLVTLAPPRKRIDADWIAKAEEKISESIRNLKNELEPMQNRLLGADDCLINKATSIRSVLVRHYRIIADIKTLLKSMLKYEDAGLSGLEEYLIRYKQYTEKLNTLTKNLISNTNLTAAVVTVAIDEVKHIMKETEGIYSDLLKFSVSDCPVRRTNPRQGDSKLTCGVPGFQERNAYAMSVWRRVKFKLEGRDPDPSVRSSEKAQVDWTISEATNLDNLALLYEGWTPWV